MIKFDRNELEHRLSDLGGWAKGLKEAINKFFNSIDAIKLLEQEDYLGLFKLFSNRYGWASWIVNGVLLLSGIDTSEYVSAITNAFNCLPTTELIIPNGVLEISDDAFYDNTFLKHITIPKSVTTIGAKIFNSCTPNQIIIIYKGTKEDWNNINKKSNWNVGYIPDGYSNRNNICNKIICTDDEIILP